MLRAFRTYVFDTARDERMKTPANLCIGKLNSNRMERAIRTLITAKDERMKTPTNSCIGKRDNIKMNQSRTSS